MSMTVKRKIPATAHDAVMKNTKECNILLDKTNKVMLECAKARIETIKVIKAKKGGFERAYRNLNQIEMAIQNLVSSAEDEEAQATQPIQQTPVRRFSLGGLPNIGNTCYLNAAIQGLLASPKFVNSLRLMPPQNPIIQKMQSIANCKDNPAAAAHLESFLVNLRNLIIANRRNGDLHNARGTAEDSAAAFEAILGECSYTLGNQTTLSTQSQDIRPSVQNENIKLVILPIRHNLNLQQIINAEFSPIQQNDPNNRWEATLNQGGMRLVTNYTITRKLRNPAPDILVFQYARADHRHQNGYNNQSIDCQTDLDMSIAFGQRLHYRLVASVNHHYPDPHYTAYVSKDDIWYHCDDSRVSIAASPPLDKATLLVYERF